MLTSLLTILTASAQPGVFVLGVDGMDPIILQRLIDDGKMPNFAALAETGTFQELGTSTPPQSPVAWSNFVTGMNPGGHGIFDFVHRDPATYHPISSATPPPGEPGDYLEVFDYIIPLAVDEVSNNRGGTPFWDILIDAGVDVEVYRIPGNYPTPPSQAHVLAGMGTVDMRGGYGTYTWYTSKPVEKDDPKGDVQLVTVQDYDLDGIPDTVSGVLRGPPDVFHLKPGQLPGASDYLTEQVTINIDPEEDIALIRVGDNDIVIEEGEWSDWVTVSFDALPAGMMAFDGTVRFYAKQLRPELEVYASPVNISPEDPSQPISSPDDFAEELYEELGFYYTQGMPEETDALKDGTFSDDDYIKQVALVQADTASMLSLALERFDPGDMSFVYVSDIDLQCHMLWRHGDPKYADAPEHPAYDPTTAPAHKHDIEGFYTSVDRLLGEVRSKLPEDTLLMVMSDHGFQPYTRKIHLNSWLREQGYLVMKDGAKTGHIVSGSVDWSKTVAYALGFNALYLNREGREAEGIVKPGEVDALLDRLVADLEAMTDPDSCPEPEELEADDTGAPAPEPCALKHVVHSVARTQQVYSGSRIDEAPDLIVGYDVGYGGSDENTLGEIVEAVIEDNTSRWSGNHLMAPEVVPGVLLINRPLPSDSHDLTDLTATLLDYYGLDKPSEMVGETILK